MRTECPEYFSFPQKGAYFVLSNLTRHSRHEYGYAESHEFCRRKYFILLEFVTH